MIPSKELIITAALGACLIGSYVLGRSDGANIEKAAVARSIAAAEAVRREKQSEIDKLGQAHAEQESNREQSVREIRYEKETVVKDPVYLNVCVTADGSRLLDQAADVANGNSLKSPSGSTSASSEGAETK